mgnify:CR=1 FL=1
MSGERFSLEQLNRALLAVYDLMSRDPGLEADYVVVGETARCLKEGRGLDVEVIELVAPVKRATVEVLSTLKTWASPEANNEVVEWKENGVPVKLTFLKETYDHFKYADNKVYGPEFYKIPNQWKDYWEKRSSFV